MKRRRLLPASRRRCLFGSGLRCARRSLLRGRCSRGRGGRGGGRRGGREIGGRLREGDRRDDGRRMGRRDRGRGRERRGVRCRRGGRVGLALTSRRDREDAKRDHEREREEGVEVARHPAATPGDERRARRVRARRRERIGRDDDAVLRVHLVRRRRRLRHLRSTRISSSRVHRCVTRNIEKHRSCHDPDARGAHDRSKQEWYFPSDHVYCAFVCASGQAKSRGSRIDPEPPRRAHISSGNQGSGRASPTSLNPPDPRS